MTTAELIEKLERADGPSRELDAAIARAFGFTVELVMVMDRRPYREWSTVHDDYGPETVTQPVKRYTASIDAAMGLVPEGSTGTLGIADGYALIEIGDGVYYSADAKTPALALCIAALKAKEADNGKSC